MQARVDWVLRIFGTQVTRKKRPVRPVLPDYLSVSYDYVCIQQLCAFIKVQRYSGTQYSGTQFGGTEYSGTEYCGTEYRYGGMAVWRYRV